MQKVSVGDTTVHQAGCGAVLHPVVVVPEPEQPSAAQHGRQPGRDREQRHTHREQPPPTPQAHPVRDRVTDVYSFDAKSLAVSAREVDGYTTAKSLTSSSLATRTQFALRKRP